MYSPCSADKRGVTANILIHYTIKGEGAPLPGVGEEIRMFKGDRKEIERDRKRAKEFEVAG